VGEQGPAGQGVGFGSEVQGVEMHPGGAQPQGGAADGVGEPLVFVFGVDNQDLDTLIEPPQRLQFGQVALAGAGAGQDDLVVVGLGPPVPADQPPGGRVGPDQDPGGVGGEGEVGGGEGEGGRGRSGVHGAVQSQPVQAHR
jgi:hypothetical protein